MSRELIAVDYALAEEAASKGAALHTIARELGIRWSTFCELRRSDERLEEAIASGRGQEHDALVGRLFAIATESKGKEAVTACIFLLKARHGYREGEPLDRGALVAVQISIPAPLEPEQYRKLLAAHPEAAEDGETVEAEVLR